MVGASAVHRRGSSIGCAAMSRGGRGEGRVVGVVVWHCGVTEDQVYSTGQGSTEWRRGMGADQYQRS